MTDIIMAIKNLAFIAIGIVGIGLLIGIHEFGHLLFAKLFGVRAPSFSIGMGPALWRKKIGETEFKVCAIPVAGYVEIAGLAEVGQGEQQDASATDEGSFSKKAWWQKIFILGGGIFFNVVLAYVIFTLLFMTGMPKSLFYQADSMKPIIASMREGACTPPVNLVCGDEIVAINQQPVTNVLEVIKHLQEHKGVAITLTIKRNQELITLNATPDNKGSIGIASYQPQTITSQGPIDAIVSSWQLTTDVVSKTVMSFASLFSKRTLDGVGGPLLIITLLVNNAKQHFAVFLFFLAFISINLAILNLIPLPITDGGQIVLTTIESIICRKIPEKVLLAIHYVSWAFIMFLAVYLTIKDFIWLFWPKIKGWF